MMMPSAAAGRAVTAAVNRGSKVSTSGFRRRMGPPLGHGEQSYMLDGADLVQVPEESFPHLRTHPHPLSPPPPRGVWECRADSCRWKLSTESTAPQHPACPGRRPGSEN